MRRILSSLAAALLAALPLRAAGPYGAWVTNSFVSTSYGSNTIKVAFTPTATDPLVMPDGTIVWPATVKATATNGVLSPTWIAPGPYTVTYGNNTLMTLPSVPADGNTYALWTLATNATALTNVASLPGVTSVGADAVAGTNFGLVSTSVGSSYTLTLTYSTNGGGGGATNVSLVNGTPGAVTITGPGVTTNGGGLFTVAAGLSSLYVTNIGSNTAALSGAAVGGALMLTNSTLTNTVTNGQSGVSLAGSFSGGFTGLDTGLTNLSGQTIAAAIQVATNTIAAGSVVGTVSSATNFTGNLSGNVTGTQGNTVVSSVGSAPLPAAQLTGILTNSITNAAYVNATNLYAQTLNASTLNGALAATNLTGTLPQAVLPADVVTNNNASALTIDNNLTTTSNLTVFSTGASAYLFFNPVGGILSDIFADGNGLEIDGQITVNSVGITNKEMVTDTSGETVNGGLNVVNGGITNDILTSGDLVGTGPGGVEEDVPFSAVTNGVNQRLLNAGSAITNAIQAATNSIAASSLTGTISLARFPSAVVTNNNKSSVTLSTVASTNFLGKQMSDPQDNYRFLVYDNTVWPGHPITAIGDYDQDFTGAFIEIQQGGTIDISPGGAPVEVDQSYLDDGAGNMEFDGLATILGLRLGPNSFDQLPMTTTGPSATLDVRGDFLLTNSANGAYFHLSTNCHQTWQDEYGTIYKSGTNGTFSIVQTNGNYVISSNGSIYFSGGINFTTNWLQMGSASDFELQAPRIAGIEFDLQSNGNFSVDTTVIANTSGLTGNGSQLTSLTSANLTGQVPIGDLTNAWHYLTNTVSASPGYVFQYTAAGFTWLNTNVFLSPNQAATLSNNIIAICTNAANLLGAAPTNILPGSLPGLSTGNGSGLTNVTYHENIFGSSIWEACAGGPTYFFPHGMGQSGNQSGLYKNDVPLFVDNGYLSNFVFSFTNANSGSTSNVGYGTNIGFYFYSNILGAPIVQVTGPSLTIVNPNTAAGTRGGLISDTTTMIPITASPSVPLYFAAAVSNLSSGASGSIIVSWSAQFFHTNK